MKKALHKSFHIHSWIESTQFKDIKPEELLEKISKRIETSNSLKSPAVILDLDSTLYDVKNRTFTILKEAKEKLSLGEETIHRIENLQIEGIHYGLEHTVLLDEKSAEFISLKEFWEKRFFHGDYLVHDSPYPGALDFVKKIYDQGIHIHYLTGRDIPRMGTGTLDKLRKDGFPLCEVRTSLSLKPDSKGDDCVYKVQKAKEWSQERELVATLENEPRIVVALAGVLPNSYTVFVDTVCSQTPAPVCNGALFRLKGFVPEK
jgi:hypothetical protein